MINRHPGVRMSRVSGRKSPITGAIVIAEVVLADAANDNATFKQAILEACREKLPAFKVPAMLRFVPALELTAGGKLCAVPCVTCWSAAARAAWAWRSPASWRRTAFASSPSAARKARR